MTLAEFCALPPHRRFVVLSDGKIGRITAWNGRFELVGVTLGEKTGTRWIPAKQIFDRDAGALVQLQASR
jgi:hypothetical protein